MLQNFDSSAALKKIFDVLDIETAIPLNWTSKTASKS